MLKIEIPEQVEVKVSSGMFEVKGPKGSVIRKFSARNVKISVSGKEVLVESDNVLEGTFIAHLRNMFKGVTAGYVRKMRAVHLHFPITLEVKGNEILIKNFIGEKAARHVKIAKGTKATVDKIGVTIEGADKDAVGQTVANIRAAIKIKQRDPRVFQDGVYEIIEE